MQLYAIMEQIAASQDHRRLAVTAASHHLAGAIPDLLQNHYAEDLTAWEISRRLGYSYTHLERVFRKEFKISIHQQLLKKRIAAAAHGLQMGKSIKEVAGDHPSRTCGAGTASRPLAAVVRPASPQVTDDGLGRDLNLILG